ncbi:NAD(P)H-quinone oxidoreductase [Bartonella sp. TP]|uniref:NAD(P)H-quinone oxidoreductase n=1 Tax=Bartonella sp. TP TaxID=3057550 RepID=UPI0025B1EB69|nr:NAD(P)H-quinone oxidoreductase [Bartonella sp. TP]MDN5248485.1 NAD(P)H-quinone oxidoreductase [Alphaproteobacteria bacterium]WJW79590.1 NAD(P)H-quinone oxidoreductase [Bartonella sp. TP]
MHNIPQKMKAIEIAEPGNASVLRKIEIEIPSFAEYEILIHTHAAGVNRPDIVQRKGLYPPPPGASSLPGLEVAGIVVAIGAKVSKYKIGDPVCALLAGGGYAEYAVAHEDVALPIPKGINFVEAAAIPETFFTVWSNLFDICHFKAGETLLVHGGTSGIGVSAIALGKAFGGKVIITAGSEDKCSFCHSLGADLAINYHTQDFVKEVLNFTENNGVDVIIDMVGGDYVNKNYKIAANDGRICQIAFLNGNLAEINLNYIMRKKLIHTGSTLRGQSIAFKSAIAKQLSQKVWPLFETKTIVPIIDKIFAIDDVQAAHNYMESGKHKGKIILQL